MSDGSALRARSRTLDQVPFLAAAIVAGALVGSFVAFTVRWPLIGVGAGACAVLVIGSFWRVDIVLFALVGLTYAHAFDVLRLRPDLPPLEVPFVAFAILLAVIRREQGTQLVPRHVQRALASFGAYGAVLFLSTLWAADRSASLQSFFAYARDMVVVFAVLVLIDRDHRYRVAMWAIIVVAATLATFTFAQWVTDSDALTFFGFAGPRERELSGASDIARAVGPLGNPNAYAQLLVIAIPLAFERFLHEPRLRLRLVALASGSLATAAAVLTFSRGGFLALLVIGAVLVVRFRRRWIPVIGVAAIAFLALGVLQGTYTSRIGSIARVLPGVSSDEVADPSIEGRAALMRIGLDMWGDHPLLGVGSANYPVRYVEYNRSVGIDPALGRYPHDLPLEVAAETGLVGLAVWLALLVAAIRSMWRTRSRLKARARPDLVGLIDGVLIALIGFEVTGLFQNNAYPMVHWLLLALCFATPALLRDDRSGEGSALDQVDDLRLGDVPAVTGLP